jgi:hypothetical protein
MMQISVTAEEQVQGELMKATKAAICEFLALHPSAVTDPGSMTLEADSARAYPIASRRHLLAMRSELGATIRDLKQKISLGYWPRSAYAMLAAELKSKQLIDIAQWHDADAVRVEQLLEANEIRTVADYRLAMEYRDTIGDPELLHKLDELMAAYEATRGAPAASAPGRTTASKRTHRAKLSPEDFQFLDILRRSAIASFEYAARHGKARVRNPSSLADRANTWRTIKIETPRELRDLERAFWSALSNLRRLRLSQDEFAGLAASLKGQGLIDVSKLIKARGSRKKAQG